MVMSQNIKFSVNLKGFDKLKEFYKDTKLIAKVGILGSTNARSDTLDNATIGAMQEFGSIEHNIPARSFLKEPIILHTKELNAVIEKTFKEKIQNKIPTQMEIEEILEILGIAGVQIVKEGFATGGYGKWQSLSPKTIAKKGNSKILVDTSQLWDSITNNVSKA